MLDLDKRAISLIKFILLTFMLISDVKAENTNVSVRKIIPPKLDTAYLGKKILCHRPMRHGSPNMSVTQVSNKIIVHNYGHGGSGWTLGPGSAAYVNSLLENSHYAKTLTKDTPITIIGAGALGLFTAYDLLTKGYKNINIIADKFENLTSHNAGGLLAPVSMDNSPEMQKIIDKIGVDAYKFYAQIANNRHPHFLKGAVIIPTYFRTRDDSGLESYVGVVMAPAKDVILDFGNGKQQSMVAYDDGIFIDTAEMMTSLMKYLNGKVKFNKRKITNFNEIEDQYIINCSGLGAQELSNDDKMISVQGHLIMLKNQKPQNLKYMILIYLGEDKTKYGQKAKRSFYIFPKKLSDSGLNDVGVLGGTFIEDATSDTPNDEEFDIMLKGAKEFYGIK